MTKRNNESFELLFYKCIGVLWFKRIVLCCEEILHVNRGYRLTNYHPERMTTGGIKNFSWLLVYNCTLHFTSIVLSLLYYLIASIGKIRITLNIIVLIMIIFNLYCIFLQRYTYLKMQQLLKKVENILNQQYKLKKAKIDTMSLIRISEGMHAEILRLIDRVEGVFLRKSSCFIDESDLCVLEQMRTVLCGIDMKIRGGSFAESSDEMSIDGGIKYVNPCKRVNMIVEIIKFIFNRKMYFEGKKSVVLVTETDKCEEVYNAVFGDDSTEIELLRIKLLKYIFLNKIQVE